MPDRILLVDDEIEIADLIEIYLKNENYTVFKFYTAKEALDCINTTTLDLAILDIMLPDMNGLALCQRIREHHHFPIIMLTAKNEETDKITGLTLGADDYITKPFRPLEVIARVKAQWCCTIKVDIENSKGQYIEKDKQEATKDGSESTKIQHGI